MERKIVNWRRLRCEQTMRAKILSEDRVKQWIAKNQLQLKLKRKKMIKVKKIIQCGFKRWFGIKYELKKIEIEQQRKLF